MSKAMKVVRGAVEDRLNPALERVEEHVRDARRAITHGQHAVEDFAADTALQVRRHPMAAIALVGASSALIGLMCGFIVGWQASHGTKRVQD